MKRALLVATVQSHIAQFHRPLIKVLKENGWEIHVAARNVRKQGTKVFYTAHGFHFYQGAPRRNWLIYYPIEMFLNPELFDMNIRVVNMKETDFRAWALNAVFAVNMGLPV